MIQPASSFPRPRPQPAPRPLAGAGPVLPAARAPRPEAARLPWQTVLDWMRGLVRREPLLVSGPELYPQPRGGSASSVTVGPGDSLAAIAARALGDANRWGELFEANRDQISDPNLIYAGQVLKLPGAAPAPAAPAAPGGTVTVKAGDTLGAIAARALGDANRWGELFEANRDQISNPNLIWPGLTLKLPGGTPAPAATVAVAAAPIGGFGDRVVAESRRLMAEGYRYPPGLGASYYQTRFQVGCCADFAVDAWTRAGVDVYQEMVDGGYNPHYVPSQMNFFRNHPQHQLLGASQPAQVGDFVFFRWPGETESGSHVAIVSEVDGRGRPTKIIESYNFNLPVRERYVGDSQGSIVGYGRL